MFVSRNREVGGGPEERSDLANGGFIITEIRESVCARWCPLLDRPAQVVRSRRPGCYKLVLPGDVDCACSKNLQLLV
jgi:hypothetical protein